MMAIPLGRVWSFPSKIVIPDHTITFPRLFLSKDGSNFTEVAGITAVNYEPAIADLVDVTNLEAPLVFQRWLRSSKDVIRFDGRGDAGFLVASDMDEINRFRIDLPHGITCDGSIALQHVKQGEQQQYSISGEILRTEFDSLPSQN